MLNPIIVEHEIVEGECCKYKVVKSKVDESILDSIPASSGVDIISFKRFCRKIKTQSVSFNNAGSLSLPDQFKKTSSFAHGWNPESDETFISK